jgi:hypothetical protein
MSETLKRLERLEQMRQGWWNVEQVSCFWRQVLDALWTSLNEQVDPQQIRPFLETFHAKIRQIQDPPRHK